MTTCKLLAKFSACYQGCTSPLSVSVSVSCHLSNCHCAIGYGPKTTIPRLPKRCIFLLYFCMLVPAVITQSGADLIVGRRMTLRDGLGTSPSADVLPVREWLAVQGRGLRYRPGDSSILLGYGLARRHLRSTNNSSSASGSTSQPDDGHKEEIATLRTLPGQAVITRSLTPYFPPPRIALLDARKGRLLTRDSSRRLSRLEPCHHNICTMPNMSWKLSDDFASNNRDVIELK